MSRLAGVLEALDRIMPGREEERIYKPLVDWFRSGVVGRTFGPGRVWSSAEVLGMTVKKRFARAFEQEGWKVYSKFFSIPRTTADLLVQVKARKNRRYRMLYARIVSETGKPRRLSRERVTPAGAVLIYAAMPGAYGGLRDLFLPRVKRRIPVAGIRATIAYSKRGIEHECEKIYGVFYEYKAKYVLIIPPFITWKIGKTAYLEAVIAREPLDGECDEPPGPEAVSEDA